MSSWRELLTSGESNRALPTEMLDSLERQRAFLGFPSYEEQLSRQASGHTPINPLEVLGAFTRPIDSVTGAPARSAVASLQEDINPWKAVGAFQKQFAENPDKAPTPGDLVDGTGIKNPWLKIPMELAVGVGADPTTFAAGLPMARNMAKFAGNLGELGAIVPGTRKTLAPIDDLGFYSKLEDEILRKMGSSATPQEILGIARNVKKSETSAVGLDKFLENKNSVTKDELLGHIRGNRPEVSLQFKSEKLSDADELRLQKAVEDEANTIAYLKSNEHGQTKTVQEIFDEIMADPSLIRAKKISELRLDKGSNPASFAKHVEPGGENYREMLVVTPNKDRPERLQEIQSLQSKLRSLLTSKSDFATTDEARQEVATILERINSLEHQQPRFYGGHWGSPDVLGHVRMNDRIIPSVGRSLHAEELQGDWPQKIRTYGTNIDELNQKIKQAQSLLEMSVQNKFQRESAAELAASEAVTLLDKFFPEKKWTHGYMRDLIRSVLKSGGSIDSRQQFLKLTPSEQKVTDEIIDQVRPKYGLDNTHSDSHDLLRDLQRLQDQKHDVLFRSSRLPPETPFNDTWEELLVKTLVNQAAKGNYDAVSLTSGHMQAKRWRGNEGLIQAYKKPEGSLKKLFTSMGGKTGSFDIPTGTVPYFQFSPEMKAEILKNGLPLFMAPWALMPQGQEKQE